MRAFAAIIVASTAAIGCERNVTAPVALPCAAPARFERQLALETWAPAVELVLADVPHQGLFPGIGAQAGWGVQRVDLALKLGARASVVLSPVPEPGHPEAVTVGRIDDEGIVALTAPLPAGHLLIVRDPSAVVMAGHRAQMSVRASVAVTMQGDSCVGIDPRSVRLHDAKSRCGNGRLEGDEACDDANAIEGDGCYACRVEAPTCMAGTEGPAAHRPWRCIGEPSRCEPVDCSKGSAPGCRETVELAAALVVEGRRDAGAEAPGLRIVDDDACPSALAVGDPVCTTERPACTPVVFSSDDGDLEWGTPCTGRTSDCTVVRPADDTLVTARARASHGVQWVRGFEGPVHRALAGAGPGGLVAVAYASSIPSITTPSAGGLVHRLATHLVMLGEDGRSRFERRIGGRAGHVQPRSVRALGDGGALLVAAFPRGQPIFGLDVDDRRRFGVTHGDVRPRPGLRVVRFDAGGDADWTHDLGDDGRVDLALTNATAYVVVDHGDTAELYAIARDGSRRFKRDLVGARVLAAFAAGDRPFFVAEVSRDTDDPVLARSIDGSPRALVVARIAADGTTAEAHRLAVPPLEARLAQVVGTDAGLVVVQSTLDASKRQSRLVATAYDLEGVHQWQQAWVSIDACGSVDVAANGDGVAVVQQTCPAGFAVDLLSAAGEPRWRERVPELPAEGLQVQLGSGTEIIVTGTHPAPASVAGHRLEGAGAFATRLAN